ncbi:hypothetical protein FACS1894204_05380 [Synergistales bacterium]|nr:hypothetical protein FACS1894204_05380 [Synergistales bacterium]
MAENNINKEFDDYRVLLAQEKEKNSGAATVGSIAINADPFTVGHRFIVEKAAGESDVLYVFVVEGEKPLLPWDERVELATNALGDLKNVTVLKSGRFVAPTLRAPGYFDENAAAEVAIDTCLDVRLFVKHIIPLLGVNARFVGTEPASPILTQYNRAMKAILTRNNVKFVECERFVVNEKPVSATQVRDLIKAKKGAEIKELVPENVCAYLAQKFSL